MLNQTCLTFGSVCSGIDAASVAWRPLGWEAAWFAEIEPFPSAVLTHHYPHVPNLGDMTKLAQMVRLSQISAPAALVGGTPCQAFSIAGLRQSLNDVRGLLTLSFVDLADAIDSARLIRKEPPVIVAWENVPGVLNTRDNAFGNFLGALAGEDRPLQPPVGKWPNAGCVFGPKRTVAWRVVDAQYFGVAQRRKRVLVIASARADLDPTEILFESEGLRRDTAPSLRTGQSITGTLSSRTTGGGGFGTDFECSGGLQPVAFGGGRTSGSIDVAACLTARGMRIDFEVETFIAQSGVGVRRLTPRECERLQGFPDDYTLVPFRGNPATDSPRYRALGNSMAIPCMNWLGKRIQSAIATNHTH